MLLKEEMRYFEGLIWQVMDELTGNGISSGMKRIYEYEIQADPLDQASMNYERDIAFMMLERKNDTLARLKEALERIKDGTYGICEECGEMISKRRLKVTPLTTFCIECQRAMESKSAGRRFGIQYIDWPRDDA